MTMSRGAPRKWSDPTTLKNELMIPICKYLIEHPNHKHLKGATIADKVKSSSSSSSSSTLKRPFIRLQQSGINVSLLDVDRWTNLYKKQHRESFHSLAVNIAHEYEKRLNIKKKSKKLNDNDNKLEPISITNNIDIDGDDNKILPIRKMKPKLIARPRIASLIEVPYGFTDSVSLYHLQHELEYNLAVIIHDITNNTSSINHIWRIQQLLNESFITYKDEYYKYGMDIFQCLNTIIFGVDPNDYMNINKNVKTWLEIDFLRYIKIKTHNKMESNEQYIVAFIGCSNVYKMIYYAMRIGDMNLAIKFAMDYKQKLGDNGEDIIKLLTNLTKNGCDDTINYNPHIPIHLDDEYMIMIYFLIGLYGLIEWNWYKKQMLKKLLFCEQHFFWFICSITYYNNDNQHNYGFLHYLQNNKINDIHNIDQMDGIQKLLITQQFEKAIEIILSNDFLFGIHVSVILDYYGLCAMPPDWPPFIEYIQYLSSSSRLQRYVFDYAYICNIFIVTEFLGNPTLTKLRELMIGTAINQTAIKQSQIYQYVGPMQYANICSISGHKAYKNGYYNEAINLFILAGESHPIYKIFQVFGANKEALTTSPKQSKRKKKYIELKSKYIPIHNHPMDGHQHETLVQSIHFQHIYHYDFCDKKWKIRCTKNNVCFYQNNQNMKIRMIARENGTEKIRINQWVYKENEITKKNENNWSEWQWIGIDATVSSICNPQFFAIKFQSDNNGILFYRTFQTAMNYNNLLPMISSSKPSIKLNLTNYSK